MERRTLMTWAQRLKWVFGIEIKTCPACGGAVRIIACIEDAEVTEKILTSLDAEAAVPGEDLNKTIPAHVTPGRKKGSTRFLVRWE
jgi:hypothetical protein